MFILDPSTPLNNAYSLELPVHILHLSPPRCASHHEDTCGVLVALTIWPPGLSLHAHPWMMLAGENNVSCVTLTNTACRAEIMKRRGAKGANIPVKGPRFPKHFHYSCLTVTVTGFLVCLGGEKTRPSNLFK